MVKPFLLRAYGLVSGVTPTPQSLSIMPEVCGMIGAIGNLPGRRQRRCEAAVADIQTRCRTAVASLKDATNNHASPAHGPRQGNGSGRVVPELNVLPGGEQNGQGIYYSPGGACRHPGHRC
jgi:hypothetical protein